jgi:protocatechuate 3,4-dioxygenase beta subunit
METFKARRVTRRTFATGAAAIALGLTARPVRAALTATPRQTLGPFYPVDWTGDIDADLVRVTGAAARALGQISYVAGRVTDLSGKPLAGADVEIWQCDANGRYHHPRDTGGRRRVDAGFQGRGRVRTDAAGAYRFRTIRPVPYPGRTPHIHFKVAADGHPDLITQMYVAGEPGNDSDFLLNRMTDARARERLIVRLDPADRLEPGALAGKFDVVVV